MAINRAGATHHYILCGWHVTSTLPLPELWPWPGPDTVPADVEIVVGRVPERLDAAEYDRQWLSVRTDGTVLLVVRNVVRLLIERGRRIAVEVLSAVDAPDWRLFLLGSAVVHLCHQRGAFPLHAASLSLGGRTVAVAGASGIGKSTLAMALLRRGHRLLSDDLTVLTQAGSETQVLPAFPRLKLWRDTLDAMTVDTTELERVREGMEKFDLKPRETFDPSPHRLDGLVLLEHGSAIRLEPVAPAAAVPRLNEQIARPFVAQLLGRQPALFAAIAKIVETVPVWRLQRTADFAELETLARTIEAAVAR